VMASGELTPAAFLMGFVLGFAAVALIEPTLGGEDRKLYASRVFAGIGFGLWFGRELVKANFEVTRDVLRPRLKIQPAIVALPIVPCGDAELALICNLITLTPGTLCLDVSAARDTLYVHGMHVEDRAEFIGTLEELAARVRRLFE